MRRHCPPHLISEDGGSRPLTPIDLRHGRIDEGWLQELIHTCPGILPAPDIDPSAGPMLSLAREVRCESGYIDNLLISPNGRLTMVETKLWRNPQATREVVAQILDYAKDVRKWSYEDLEDAVRKASPSSLGANGSIYSLVADDDLDLTEDEFVDAVQRTLATGRFLLLVVGDGIRENVEAMLDVLHTTPDLLFTFGLVELQIFEDESVESRIVIPQVIARTTEIVRAVVKLEGDAREKVSISLDERPSGSGTGRKRLLSEEEFYDSLGDPRVAEIFNRIANRAAELGAVPEPATRHLRIMLPDPVGGSQMFTLFYLGAGRDVFFGWFPIQLENNGYPRSIGIEMLREIAELFEDVEWKEGSEGLTRSLTAQEVDENLDSFIRVVGRAVERVRDHAGGQPG